MTLNHEQTVAAQADTNHPFWTHDCNKCEFLGGMVIKGSRYDAYVCARRNDRSPDSLDSLLCRNGSREEDYSCAHPSHYNICGAPQAATRAMYLESRGVKSGGGDGRRWVEFDDGTRLAL